MASGPGWVLPVVIVKWHRPSEALRTVPLPKVKLPKRSGADPAGHASRQTIRCPLNKQVQHCMDLNS